MIASQDEVPDTSFPYDRLISRLCIHSPADDVEGICKAVPDLYHEAYQDYAMKTKYGMRYITLATLRLDRLSSLTTPLKVLAQSLLTASLQPALGKEIVEARAESQDFAVGMFVDIFDFCARLLAREEKLTEELKTACKGVCDAISASGESSFIVDKKNNRGATRCNGISIYFPYLLDETLKRANECMVSSGTDLIDQLTLLVKGGSPILRKARFAKISQFEEDVQYLDTFLKTTNWYKFITHGWSYILATVIPDELDLRYSGQQIASNLLLRNKEEQEVKSVAA
jgi:hypothetical protein